MRLERFMLLDIISVFIRPGLLLAIVYVALTVSYLN